MTAIMDDARTWSHVFLFSPYGAGSRRHLDERFSAPEVLKPIRSQLGVTHCVLDVLVAEPCLQRPRIVPGIGQGVATGVPQHMREDGEGHMPTQRRSARLWLRPARRDKSG